MNKTNFRASNLKTGSIEEYKMSSESSGLMMKKDKKPTYGT